MELTTSSGTELINCEEIKFVVPGSTGSVLIKGNRLSQTPVQESLDDVVLLSQGRLVKFTDVKDSKQKAVNCSFIDRILSANNGNTIILTSNIAFSFQANENLATIQNRILTCAGVPETSSPDGYIYVSSVSGNDIAGDGTRQKPYQTIDTAYSKASSGDNIYIYAGEYTGELNMVTKDISIFTEPGARIIGYQFEFDEPEAINGVNVFVRGNGTWIETTPSDPLIHPEKQANIFFEADSIMSASGSILVGGNGYMNVTAKFCGDKDLVDGGNEFLALAYIDSSGLSFDINIDYVQNGTFVPYYSTTPTTRQCTGFRGTVNVANFKLNPNYCVTFESGQRNNNITFNISKMIDGGQSFFTFHDSDDSGENWDSTTMIFNVGDYSFSRPLFGDLWRPGRSGNDGISRIVFNCDNCRYTNTNTLQSMLLLDNVIAFTSTDSVFMEIRGNYNSGKNYFLSNTSGDVLGHFMVIDANITSFMPQAIRISDYTDGRLIMSGFIRADSATPITSNNATILFKRNLYTTQTVVADPDITWTELPKY